MTDIVDRSRRERLKAIKQDLGGLDQRVARATWEWGSLLGEVERDELWREDDAPTFSDWLTEELDVSRAQAQRAILIARHFSADMAERFGTRKLTAIVAYTELTGKEEQPGDVLALGLRVRDDRGHFVTVPFLEATGRQIERACAELRASAKGKDEKARLKDLGADVRGRAARLTEALPPSPPGTVRGERVSVQKGKDGRMAVSIQGIPMDDLEAVIEALRKHLAG